METTSEPINKSMNEDVCVCMCEYYTAIKKRWNFAIWDNMNGSWKYA